MTQEDIDRIVNAKDENGNTIYHGEDQLPTPNHAPNRSMTQALLDNTIVR